MKNRHLSREHVATLLRFLRGTVITASCITALIFIPFWISYIPHTIPASEPWTLGFLPIIDTTNTTPPSSNSWTADYWESFETRSPVMGYPYNRWFAGMGDLFLLVLNVTLIASLCRAGYFVFDWLFPKTQKITKPPIYKLPKSIDWMHRHD